jgi:hypothetical protein
MTVSLTRGDERRVAGGWNLGVRVNACAIRAKKRCSTGETPSATVSMLLEGVPAWRDTSPAFAASNPDRQEAPAMFGMKTLVVGGGAAALLWMMNTHASAGDLVDNVKNGASTVSNGYQSLADGYQNLQNGYHSLSSGASGVSGAQSGVSGLSGLPGLSGLSGAPSGDSGSGSGLSGPAVELKPSAARPGQQVLITVPTCIQPESGTATSAVFTNNGSVALTRNPRGAGLAGVATIVSNAQNGNWSVNVTCGSGIAKLNGVTNITIFGGANPTPTSPPRAGGGGSVMKGDMGMTAGGIALVAGGVAYGLWTMRRRGSDGTHAG